jgi:hypothetical protein
MKSARYKKPSLWLPGRGDVLVRDDVVQVIAEGVSYWVYTRPGSPDVAPGHVIGGDDGVVVRTKEGQTLFVVKEDLDIMIEADTVTKAGKWTANNPEDALRELGFHSPDQARAWLGDLRHAPRFIDRDYCGWLDLMDEIDKPGGNVWAVVRAVGFAQGVLAQAPIDRRVEGPGPLDD